MSFLGNNSQKGKFDGLHKQLKNDFEKNYQRRKLYARKFEKCQKNPKKYWKDSHGPRKCPRMQNNPQNIQINCFAGWKIQEKFQRNYQTFQNIYTYFIKINLIFFIHEISTPTTLSALSTNQLKVSCGMRAATLCITEMLAKSSRETSPNTGICAAKGKRSDAIVCRGVPMKLWLDRNTTRMSRAEDFLR